MKNPINKAELWLDFISALSRLYLGCEGGKFPKHAINIHGKLSEKGQTPRQSLPRATNIRHYFSFPSDDIPANTKNYRQIPFKRLERITSLHIAYIHLKLIR